MMRRNGFSLPLFVFCGLLAAGLFLVAANGRGHLAAGGPTALGSSPSLCKKPSFTSTQPRGLFGLGRAAQTPRRTVRRFAVDVQPVVEAQPDQKSVWVDRHSQTKMIATVGPSTRNEEMIEAMWQGGADVFRVPMYLALKKTSCPLLVSGGNMHGALTEERESVGWEEHRYCAGWGS
uniref:Uncharacterized protein n=1 Tax=Lotharella globosa TaxID=91324 RepID=A0A7S3YPY5_9EUKA